MAIQKVRMEQVTDDLGNTTILHPETSADNVLHMGNTLDKMVTLDGESQQNFNFIRSNVVQDELVESRGFDRSTFATNIGFTLSQDFAIQTEVVFESLEAITTYYVYYVNANYYSYMASDKVIVVGGASKSLNRSLKIGDTEKIILIKYGNVLNINIADTNLTVFIKDSAFTGEKIYIGRYNVTQTKANIRGLSYNKTLSPQEIQHNFTVLNNAESINALNVADKKLLLVVPKLYKEKKTLLGTWTEIPYTETRDLTNYNYKFM